MSLVIIQKCYNRTPAKFGGHMPMSEFKLNQESYFISTYTYVYMCVYVGMHGLWGVCVCVCLCVHILYLHL